MTLSIDITTLLTTAALVLLWCGRDLLWRLPYMLAAAALGAILRRRYGAIVVIVGAVDEPAAERWSALVRACSRRGGPLTVLIHSDGGHTHARAIIARAIAQHPGPVTARVPIRAWSAGAALAYTADKIHMGDDAVLGPCDPHRGADDNRIWCARDIAARDRGDTTAGMLRSEHAVEECATAMRANWAARRRVLGRPQVMPGDDAAIAALILGTRNHWHPLFIHDIAALGFAVAVENDPHFAILARWSMAALPEDQR